MVASDFCSVINLTYCGDTDDLMEVMELFASENRGYFTVKHSVTDSGEDRYIVIDRHDDNAMYVFSFSDISDACIRYVFSERTDLFPLFMQGGEWSNGNNMNGKIATDIVLSLIL